MLIFILPPSWEELERRLRNRATDDPETIRRRLEMARREMEERSFYDQEVVNDEVAGAVRKILEILGLPEA